MPELAESLRNAPARAVTESRTGIIVIILISSLVFLLLQARKDVQSTLAIQEARLTSQFALAVAQPEIAAVKTVLDDPGKADISNTDRLMPLPGQVTIAIASETGSVRDPVLSLLGVQASDTEDTQGRFIVRNGMLFAAMRNSSVVVMTSMPLASVLHGLFGRIAIDIACVVFFASLMLLIRESRLTGYSVRRMLDASPVPLLVLDEAGRTEFANEPAIGLLAANPADSLDGVQSTFVKQPEIYRWLMASDVADRVETGEFEIAIPAQKRKRLLVSRQSLIVRSRRLIVASAVDITVHFDAEKALLRAKNAAEELGRLKAESLAMISHELRTPINGVLGLAEILGRQEGLTDNAGRIVGRLIQASKTLGTIISDVFDFALLEVRQLRLESRLFDPKETITGAVAIASAAARQKGLRVRVLIVSALPQLLIGDPSRLQQIIINLVGNGIKFTERGGVDVSVDVSQEKQSSIRLGIEVADTGIGITPDILPRLFQPFSQAETGPRRRYEGTGLGLAITRTLAEAMGGTITVDSTPGEGSRFLVDIPFLLGKAGETMPVRPIASRILVVDDVDLNRDIIAELLSMEGCFVRTAASAEEAFSILETERFDIILMDIYMPEMDGLTASQIIRSKQGPAAHKGSIIGLTANPAPTNRPLYCLRGMDDILEKPADTERIRIALQRNPSCPHERTSLPERLWHLYARLGPERTARIVDGFREVAADDAERIVNCCAQLDSSGLVESAHRLAGAAANVGFEALSEQASTLETAAENGAGLETAEAALELVYRYKAAMRVLSDNPLPLAAFGRAAAGTGSG